MRFWVGGGCCEKKLGKGFLGHVFGGLYELCGTEWAGRIFIRIRIAKSFEVQVFLRIMLFCSCRSLFCPSYVTYSPLGVNLSFCTRPQAFSSAHFSSPLDSTHIHVLIQQIRVSRAF